MAERQHGEAPAPRSDAPRVNIAAFAPLPAVEPVRTDGAPSALTDLQRAASESARALDPALRTRLETGLGRDFSCVRVHSGPKSARTAERMGARAYTLGNDIHLGAEAQALPSGERSHLLTHEAVHTVQQGGGRVAPHAGLSVSSPNDAAEIEAEHIAQALHAPRSSSLALRDSLRSAPLVVARSVVPQLQRDLTDKLPVREGEFKMNLKTESHPGGSSGMLGTIEFMANSAAPDSREIKLLQTARVQGGAGQPLIWSGADANRNKVTTVEDRNRGVEGGWLVDHSPAAAAPRKTSGDAPVSPYFRDYWPNRSKSQNGSKSGKSIKKASLADFPQSTGDRIFSLETIAKATDTGHVYGTVMWGFTISDASKGKVEKERAVGRNVALITSDKAIENFNEFYRNPGASTAP